LKIVLIFMAIFINVSLENPFSFHPLKEIDHLSNDKEQ
jgi:hypothetical protein